MFRKAIYDYSESTCTVLEYLGLYNVKDNVIRAKFSYFNDQIEDINN